VGRCGGLSPRLTRCTGLLRHDLGAVAGQHGGVAVRGGNRPRNFVGRALPCCPLSMRESQIARDATGMVMARTRTCRTPSPTQRLLPPQPSRPPSPTNIPIQSMTHPPAQGNTLPLPSTHRYKNLLISPGRKGVGRAVMLAGAFRESWCAIRGGSRRTNAPGDSRRAVAGRAARGEARRVELSTSRWSCGGD